MPDPVPVGLLGRASVPIDRRANLLLLLRRVAFDARVAERGRSHVLDAASAVPNEDVSDLARAAHERRRAAVTSLCRHGAVAYEVNVTTRSRLAVGMSSETPLEAGLALHGTYGLPVIPGTALKGVARRSPQFDSEADASGAGRHLFGDGDRRGAVTIFDALPAISPQLGIDVVTPHVNPYYAGTGPPAEYWQPIPFTFLTVMRDASFTAFVVGDEPSAAAAASTLVDAIQEFGIGGKTAAGYGYVRASARVAAASAGT